MTWSNLTGSSALVAREDTDLLLLGYRLPAKASICLPSLTAAHSPPQGTDSQELLLVLSLGGAQVLPSLEGS